MQKLSKEQRTFLESATLRYMDHLDEAEDWLAGRGLRMDHARSNGLGVVRNPNQLHAAYEGRLAIPYLTDAGPVTMAFRCISHAGPCVGHKKILFPPKSGTYLYGVQSLQDADEWIAVTEGEIDRLTLTQIGIPAVGIAGAEKWEPHWSNVFEDFSKIIVFRDGDQPGKDMAKSIRYNVNTSVITVDTPDGEDVNSIYMKEGADWLLDWIKK